ncbi:hypothetical protein DFH07DRAFT_776828 [Mycena maculata]|uniref:Uncharacterized protein n=1 Tax=Mycena maculata TaxID=230809 RepID=A0AAD7IN48_9AGAR|nr:hypothetical protein DFH07DRAFT_776828 [Mycena maculata]
MYKYVTWERYVRQSTPTGPKGVHTIPFNRSKILRKTTARGKIFGVSDFYKNERLCYIGLYAAMCSYVRLPLMLHPSTFGYMPYTWSGYTYVDLCIPVSMLWAHRDTPETHPSQNYDVDLGHFGWLCLHRLTLGLRRSIGIDEPSVYGGWERTTPAGERKRMSVAILWLKEFVRTREEIVFFRADVDMHRRWFTTRPEDENKMTWRKARLGNSHVVDGLDRAQSVFVENYGSLFRYGSRGFFIFKRRDEPERERSVPRRTDPTNRGKDTRKSIGILDPAGNLPPPPLRVEQNAESIMGARIVSRKKVGQNNEGLKGRSLDSGHAPAAVLRGVWDSVNQYAQQEQKLELPPRSGQDLQKVTAWFTSLQTLRAIGSSREFRTQVALSGGFPVIRYGLGARRETPSAEVQVSGSEAQ